MSTMDKIAGLKEILALDPKNSFARYGIAMELASRGEVGCGACGIRRCWSSRIPTTPRPTSWRRRRWPRRAGTPEAIERLKAGIACAARTGNRHALSEMQAMLDELDR